MRNNSCYVTMTLLALLSIGCSDDVSPRANAQVSVQDQCDPATFNAALGNGTCSKQGTTTFAQFNSELNASHQVAAWRFVPNALTIRVGQAITATNTNEATHQPTAVTVWPRYTASRSGAVVFGAATSFFAQTPSFDRPAVGPERPFQLAPRVERTLANGLRVIATRQTAIPKVSIVAPATAFTALDGKAYTADQVDVLARIMSMGNCHRAFALTGAMCLAVAARLDGTLVHECTTGATRAAGRPMLRLGHPSGILPIDAAVSVRDGAPWAERVTVYRTARRLMEGFLRIP